LHLNHVDLFRLHSVGISIVAFLDFSFSVSFWLVLRKTAVWVPPSLPVGCPH